MEEQGWFKDANGSLVHPDDIGDFVGKTKPVGSSPRLSRAPTTGMTKTFRPPIGGNPNGIWAWWIALKPEYRYGIVGGLGLLGVIIAASQAKGKANSLEKV